MLPSAAALYNLGSMIGICGTQLESMAPLLFDEESPLIVYFTNKLAWSTSKLVLTYTSIRFIGINGTLILRIYEIDTFT